jgi:hypothetical protein
VPASIVRHQAVTIIHDLCNQKPEIIRNDETAGTRCERTLSSVEASSIDNGGSNPRTLRWRAQFRLA